MSFAPVYIASDAHLGASPPDMERAFRRWLDFAAERAGMILINGDLFDFWFEWGAVVPRGHTRVLGTLARIVDAGVPVHLVGGNHDWWGGEFLTHEVGITFHRAPVRLDLAGYRTLVAHGDGLGNGDVAYRMLRTILRSAPARWAFRWLHPDLGAAVARRVSRTEVDRPGGEDRARVRSDILERWARDRLLEDEKLDMIALGHTHLPRRVEVAPGRFYLNSGDWMKHCSYIVVSEGCPPRLERWGDR